MNKNYFLILLILGIILVASCIQQPSEPKKEETIPNQKFEECRKSSKNPYEFRMCFEDEPDLENIYECLEKQKEEYKPGWEGAPTRVLNKCEIFVYKSNNLTILNLLVETRDFPTLVAISRNSNSPKEILSKIYQRKDISKERQDQIKIALSENINTPPSILAELGKFDVINERYKDIRILRGIAKNPSTPVDTLEALSRHKNLNVLRDVASNSKTSEDVLIYLSQDLKDLSPYGYEEDVHIELARNPNTPKEILIKFLKEKGKTSIISDFGDNIVRIENEILELEDYYMEHFPRKYKNVPPTNGNYHRLLGQLVTNPKTSEKILKIIIRRNYVNVYYNNKPLTELAQDNLNGADLTKNNLIRIEKQARRR